MIYRELFLIILLIFFMNTHAHQEFYVNSDTEIIKKVSYIRYDIPKDGVLNIDSNVFCQDLLKKDSVIMLHKDDNVNFNGSQYFPFVAVDSNNDNIYGYISAGQLNTNCKPSKIRKPNIKKILSHNIGNNTVIYVICPKERNSLCRILIKHKNKWVMNNKGAILTLKGIAKSNKFHSQSKRITGNSDTPQGVYKVYAKMLCNDREFGLKPRLNLDSVGINFPPDLPIGTFSKKKIDILPQCQQNLYWFKEWPLSFAMGRRAIRMHGNQIGVTPFAPEWMNLNNNFYRRSRGCINLGIDIDPFFDILDSKLGIFNANYKEGKFGIKWYDVKKGEALYVVVVDL